MGAAHWPDCTVAREDHGPNTSGPNAAGPNTAGPSAAGPNVCWPENTITDQLNPLVCVEQSRGAVRVT